MNAWPLAQAAQLLRWAETGQLSAAQLRAAECLAPLQPSRAHWWALGERLCAVAGVLLLAAGIVFFFAYNWAQLHHWAKLALAGTALGVSVLAALCARPGALVWQSSLLGASLCTGALLALIGQTYQTGADIWELFAAWTLLMLPFVLLARAWPSWLLCLLVSNLCVLRLLYLDGLWRLGVRSGEAKLAVFIGVNLLWCLLAGCWGRWLVQSPKRYLERLTAALALAGLSWGAMLGVLEEKINLWSHAYGAYVLLFVGLIPLLLWVYRVRRLDVAMLGVLCACVILVGASFLVRVLLLDDIGEITVPLVVLALYIAGTSGYAAVWLRGLLRAQARCAALATDAVHQAGPQP